MSKRTIRNSRRKTSRRSTRGRSRRETRMRSRRKTRMRSRRDNYKRIYKSRNKRRTVVKSRLNRKSLKKNKRTKKSKIKHGGSPGYTWREWEIQDADKAIREQEKLCKELGLVVCNWKALRSHYAAAPQNVDLRQNGEDSSSRAQPCEGINRIPGEFGDVLQAVKKEECLVLLGLRGDLNKRSQILQWSYLENIFFDEVVNRLLHINKGDVERVKWMKSEEVDSWLNDFIEEYGGLISDDRLRNAGVDKYPFVDKIKLIYIFHEIDNSSGSREESQTWDALRKWTESTAAWLSGPFWAIMSRFSWLVPTGFE